jgi:DNA-binding MarR family transcriptional regulator
MSTIPHNFYQSLTEFLLQSKQYIIAASAEHGLTSMQAMTLLMTNNETPRSMSTFCKMYDCDASNITGIIDGLEKKGLVSRRDHPKDRRIKIIHLEPAGKTMQEALTKSIAKTSADLLAPLNAHETEQFVAIIHKLAQHSALHLHD